MRLYEPHRVHSFWGYYVRMDNLDGEDHYDEHVETFIVAYREDLEFRNDGNPTD